MDKENVNCSKCGREVTGSANFCPSCGTLLKEIGTLMDKCEIACESGHSSKVRFIAKAIGPSGMKVVAKTKDFDSLGYQANILDIDASNALVRLVNHLIETGWSLTESGPEWHQYRFHRLSKDLDVIPMGTNCPNGHGPVIRLEGNVMCGSCGWPIKPTPIV